MLCLTGPITVRSGQLIATAGVGRFDVGRSNNACFSRVARIRRFDKLQILFRPRPDRSGFAFSIILGSSMLELVVGSGNAHKIAELRALLPRDRFRLIPLSELETPLDVEETGLTFCENARLKATLQAKHLNRWVLAEDSGLEVDALSGQPGVFSARFAGRHGDDVANNLKLLKEMADFPSGMRGASFRCFVCVSSPQGIARIEVNDVCRGRIGTEPQGEGGFGYDPLFIIPEYHQSFGQLGVTIKNVLSHRSRALRKVVPRLLELVASGEFA